MALEAKKPIQQVNTATDALARSLQQDILSNESWDEDFNLMCARLVNLIFSDPKTSNIVPIFPNLKASIGCRLFAYRPRGNGQTQVPGSLALVVTQPGLGEFRLPGMSPKQKPVPGSENLPFPVMVCHNARKSPMSPLYVARKFQLVLPSSEATADLAPLNIKRTGLSFSCSETPVSPTAAPVSADSGPALIPSLPHRSAPPGEPERDSDQTVVLHGTAPITRNHPSVGGNFTSALACSLPVSTETISKATMRNAFEKYTAKLIQKFERGDDRCKQHILHSMRNQILAYQREDSAKRRGGSNGQREDLETRSPRKRLKCASDEDPLQGRCKVLSLRGAHSPRGEVRPTCSGGAFRAPMPMMPLEGKA